MIKTAIKPRLLKGFRDYTPKMMLARSYCMSLARLLFERYGFQGMDTPLLEYADVLTGKYGSEGEQLMYRFLDHGKREVALRYDLTIPFARFMAMHQDIPLPFRRYQLGPVFRADNTQRGRFREFYQCDVDIAGSFSYIAEVELLSLAYDFFCEIDIPDFTIKINDRRVLFGLLNVFGFQEDKYTEILRSIDKIDKIGMAAVEKELLEKGFEEDKVTDFMSLLTLDLSFEEFMSCLRDKIPPDEEQALEGVDNLEKIFVALRDKGGVEGAFVLDLSLARGLSYYTGAVFEAVAPNSEGIGSLMGGGRYDNLIGMFSGKSIPAVGLSFGIERIIALIEEQQRLLMHESQTDVLVTIFSEELIPSSLALARELRATGKIYVDVFPESAAKLSKQLEYADKLGIPIALVIGPDEIAREEVTVKNLRESEQKIIRRADVIHFLEVFLGKYEDDSDDDNES